MTLDVDPKPIESRDKEEEFIYLTIDNNRPAASKTLYAKSPKGKPKGAAQQQSYYNQQPTNEGLLSEQELKKAHPSCYDGFKDPLSEDDKRILHENFRREPATRRALEFRAEFVLGERTELAMRPTKSFATQAREDAETKLLMDDPANLDLLDELAGIDEAVDLNNNLTALFISGRQFARSVLVKQYDSYGIPIRLIPLASVRLGKVYVDSETWELIGIEYKDYQGEKRIIRAQDMIHYEASDYHVTPNSRYFGLSDGEPVMHIAAGLRITNEVAIPEMRTEGWAPLDIIQFPDIASQEKLNELRDSIKPGKRLILGKGSAIHTKIDMQGDLEKTIKSVEESTKDILRAYGVPLVVAFQDEQNRSTAQYALNQMKVSVLEKDRTKLRNVLEPQWYIPNLRALMRKRQGKMQQEEGEAEYDEGIIPALERSARILELDPEQIELPFKPKMMFRDKSFDTFLEKSAALLGWLNANAMTIPMALSLADLEKEAEEMKTEIANRKEMLLTQTTPLTPEPSPGVQTTPTTNSAIPNFPVNSALGGSSQPKNKKKKDVKK